MTMHAGAVAMEVVAATISTRLFCLSVTLTTKDSFSSTPATAWWVPPPLLPALLASLLHATVIRPLAVAAARHYCLKLEDTLSSSSSSSSSSTWLRRVVNKVTAQVLRILLSEQTSLWLLFLMAQHLFDINVKLKVQVQVGTLRAMLGLLLNNTARLLLRLVTGSRGTTVSTDEDEAAADDDGRRRRPGAREREDGLRRSARKRRPNVRVAGPEWDKRLRG